MTYYALSLGAGVNSTAMLLLLEQQHAPLDCVIFADTGAEKPETYTYLKGTIIPWLTEKGIQYQEVRAKKSLLERCASAHSLPSRNLRWSTRDLKILPITRLLRSHKPVTTYMGIAYDEIHRIAPSHYDWETKVFPLVDAKITRQGCIEIIKAAGWPVPVKSGCFLCPFANIADWKWLYHMHPDLWQKAREVEESCYRYPEWSLHNGGLVKLEARFRGEDSQVTLDSWTDECGGHCFV